MVVELYFSCDYVFQHTCNDPKRPKSKKSEELYPQDMENASAYLVSEITSVDRRLSYQKKDGP